MARPDRWWRPSTSRRPPLWARQRQMYSGKELDATFDTAYQCGEIAERKRHERRDEQITALARAADAAAEGDPSLLDEFCRKHVSDRDDLLDVADAAGATPLAEVDGDKLADEVEQWLRGVDGAGPDVV